LIGPDDVRAAAATFAGAVADDRDWSVPAGDLEWSVAELVDHVATALLHYSTNLTLRTPKRARLELELTEPWTQPERIGAVVAMADQLAATIERAPAGARGFHSMGFADASGFAAMACDELLVHGWDAASGLGTSIAFNPELCARVVARLFPWSPTGVEPADALLWCNGRVALDDHARLDPDWPWWCAPLDEWDGIRPSNGERRDTYVKDPSTGRWIPT